MPQTTEWQNLPLVPAQMLAACSKARSWSVLLQDLHSLRGFIPSRIQLGFPAPSLTGGGAEDSNEDATKGFLRIIKNKDSEKVFFPKVVTLT